MYDTVWNEVLKVKGYQINQRKNTPNEELLLELVKIVRKHGSFPTQSEFHQYSREGAPEWTTYQKRFGNKKGVIRALKKYVKKNDLKLNI